MYCKECENWPNDLFTEGEDTHKSVPRRSVCVCAAKQACNSDHRSIVQNSPNRDSLNDYQHCNGQTYLNICAMKYHTVLTSAKETTHVPWSDLTEVKLE